MSPAPHRSSLKRVTILNTYSRLNKGDLAIVLGTAAALKRAHPQIQIAIVSQTPDEDRDFYASRDIEVLGGPFGLIYDTDRSKLIRYLAFAVGGTLLAAALVLVRWLGPSGTRWLPGALGRLAAAIAASDVAISCGGGFWHDSDGGAGIRLHLLQLGCAFLANVPVVALGQSLGPFRSRWRLRLVGAFLRRAAAVVVREPESLPTGRAMGLTPARLHLGADMAFALAAMRDAAPPRPRIDVGAAQRPQVGVTVRDWWFPGSEDPHQAQMNYERALAETLDWIIETYDAEIVFLPQVIGPGADDDRVTARRLAGRLKQSWRATVRDDDLAPEDLMDLIGRLDFVIATRFHSAIFTMLAGTPVIAIAYEHKTTGIMGSMGLKQWTLAIEQVEAAELKQLVQSLVAEKDSVRLALALACRRECQKALASVAVCEQTGRQRRGHHTRAPLGDIEQAEG